MMTSKPLLSIVVPTKNGYEYLRYLILLIESFRADEIELVIQDNTPDNTNFLPFVEEHKASWIKYYHEASYLTSVQNFDKAVLNSTGEYVCFIGDDDGVMSCIVDCVKWMRRNHIEALRSSLARYFWSKPNINGRVTEKFLYFYTPKYSYSFSNPITDLLSLLKDECELNYIPLLYNGIVKRSVLDAIYKDLHTFFPGASADIANGVALCFYVKRYVKLNVPIIIGGSSPHVGGGVTLKKNLRIEDVPFIDRNVAIEWEGHIPHLWYGTLVWIESAIKSLRALGKVELMSFIDQDKMLAKFYFSYKNRVAGIKSICKDYCVSCMKFRVYVMKLYACKFFLRGINRIYKLITHGKKDLYGHLYYDVENIMEAEQILNRYIPKNFFVDLDEKNM